ARSAHRAVRGDGSRNVKGAGAWIGADGPAQRVIQLIGYRADNPGMYAPPRPPATTGASAQRQAQANAYRESDVLSASPARLLIITFDGLLMAMTRFRVGLAMKNDELARTSASTARLALCELLATLDRDAGGSLADRLASIYAFVLSELDAIAHRPDLKRL